LSPANEGSDGRDPAASLLKSGMPGNDGICGRPCGKPVCGIGEMPIWGICGIGKGMPVPPGGVPSERHALIHASNNCCMPAAGVALFAPACGVCSFAESVLGEAEECGAAIPAFDR
jgi:hypothetical protein